MNTLHWVEQSINSLIDEAFNIYVDKRMHLLLAISYDVNLIKNLLSEQNQSLQFAEYVKNISKKIIDQHDLNENDLTENLHLLNVKAQELFNHDAEFLETIIKEITKLSHHFSKLINVFTFTDSSTEHQIPTAQQQNVVVQAPVKTPISSQMFKPKGETDQPQQLSNEEQILNMQWLDQAFEDNEIYELKSEMNGYPGFIKLMNQLYEEKFIDAITTSVLLFKQRSHVRYYQRANQYQDPRAEWTLIFAKILIERIHNHLNFEEFQELMAEHLSNLPYAIEQYKDMFI
jgi:hypothetical protein